MPGRQQACQSVERGGEVIPVTRDGFPGMQRHAYRQRPEAVGQDSVSNAC